MRLFIVAILLFATSYAQTEIFKRIKLGESKLMEDILQRKSLNEFSMTAGFGVKSIQAVNRKPVVFIAAMTGSRIMGKLNYPSSHVKPGVFCWTKSDWYLLYAGTDVNDPAVPSTLLPTNYMCTLDNMKLNLTTTPAKTVDGVQTKIIGETDIVTGNRSALIGWDFVALKHELVGYQWDVDMFAHPYDFRFGAEEYKLDEWNKLKNNVELAYHTNGNKKVVLQSLSMGGTYTSGFLSTMTQLWKDTYIDSWISIAGSLNGSTYNIGSIINGEDYGMPYVNKQYFADMYSTWPSSIWVTPVADHVDGIIAYTPSFNYSISQMPQLMYKAGLFDTGDLKQKFYNKNSWNTANDPGVKTWCWFSYNVPTVNAIRWTDESLSANSREDVMGGGDGVVHIDGLRVCDQWNDTETWVYENVPHAAEMGTEWALDRIIKIVADVQNCNSVGDSYTSDCGKDCNPGDLKISSQGCGFFNTKEANQCLKINRWTCDSHCGAKPGSCVTQPNKSLEKRDGGCNQDGKDDQPFYEECQAYAKTQGASFYTYHGDAYPTGCYSPLITDSKMVVGYNFKDDSISNCTGQGKSLLPVQTCYCRSV